MPPPGRRFRAGWRFSRMSQARTARPASVSPPPSCASRRFKQALVLCVRHDRTPAAVNDRATWLRDRRRLSKKATCGSGSFVGDDRGRRDVHAAFVGETQAGPAERRLELLTSVIDFERHYGGGADLVHADGSANAEFRVARVRGHSSPMPADDCMSRERRQRTASRRRSPTSEPPSNNSSTSTSLRLSLRQARRSDMTRNGQDPGARIRALLDHAALVKNRFAVIDCGDEQSTAAAPAMRASFDSAFGALDDPWVRVADPNFGRDLHLPPSGFVSESTRVWI